METRKCSLTDLRQELIPRLKEHLSSEDEILVCYETKREIKNSVDVPHTSFTVAVVTPNRLIWGELRLFKSLWGYNGKSDVFVKSWLLEEIGGVTEQTQRDSGFAVIITQNGVLLALTLFALREMSVNFANMLRQAIKQAKA